MTALSDIEVVLVAYLSRDLVASLFASLPEDLPMVVVDNADGRDQLAELVAGRRNARYLRGGGVGFARAANLGARTSELDYLVFVNPDTRPTVDQLTALVGDLAGDPTLMSVAATTTAPDGRVELGVGGWEPTLLRTFVYASGLHARFPRAGLYARPRPGECVGLDWLTGACLAVPRSGFLRIGGFDESYFLYNEDMDYGRRVREAGLRQRLRTDVLVPHAGGGSGAAKLVMLQMRGASMMTYLTRHHPPLAVQGMRLLLSSGAWGRWAVCRARARRDTARGFAAYARGLWCGAPDMR